MGADRLAVLADVGDQHDLVAGVLGVLALLGPVVFADLAEMAAGALVIGRCQILVANGQDQVLQVGLVNTRKGIVVQRTR